MAKTIEDFNAEVIAAEERYDFVRSGQQFPGDWQWLYSDQLASSTRTALSALTTARLRRARFNGTHTIEEWEKLKEACDYKCLRCGGEPVQKDHIIPLVHSDCSDSIDNLQPLCGRCNKGKGTKRISYLSQLAVRDGD